MIGDSASRACVFIDSSNPSAPGQLINSSTPTIRPPFPPHIDPHDLISTTPTPGSKKNSNHNKIPSRAPNAFIIYRKTFIETARSQGYYLPMTVISSMASQSWEKESDVVKSEYRRLAKEAFRIRCELLPKPFASSRRRKREKWNIISFEDNNNGGLVSIKRNWSSSRSNNEEVPYPSPALSTPTISSPEINININNNHPIPSPPPLLFSSSGGERQNFRTEIPQIPQPQIPQIPQIPHIPQSRPPSNIQLLLNQSDEE